MFISARFLLLALAVWLLVPAFAQSKPNILVIMFADVGMTNISAHSRGR